MLELGPLAFASPWILAALALLPLLWWLLRVTPPAPRHVRFPAIRLLFGLESPERTPESSPLWLILLRLAAVAALILALAHPLMNPSGMLQGNGPLLLVVDDGWAAASRWKDRQEAMRQAGDGKLLAFCRSGTRSALALALAQRDDGVPREDIERRVTDAGFDVGPIAHLL